MRIVIDLQGAQSVRARHGKMSEYSLALVQEVIRNRGEHEVVIALSGQFPETIEGIRARFDKLLPQDNIRVWYAVGPLNASNPGNTWRRHVAEYTREAFLASLRPDVIWVMSLFEGFDDDAVTSVGALTNQLPTVVSLLDLDGTPLGDAVSNGEDPNWRDWCICKGKQLAQATRVFVFSEAARQEGIRRFGLSEQAIVKLENTGCWEQTAQQVIASFEQLQLEQALVICKLEPKPHRPKLAFLSPLPPERSGIADYSAELLPELACYYDIDVIVDQPEISDPWICEHLPIRSVEWFIQHVEQYDRILYHFGNSPFHQHMFELIERFPGVIVLHDFFLGHIQAHRDLQGIAPEAWSHELYHAHGYQALCARLHAKNWADCEKVVFQYPCNLSVLQHSIGVIVHSTQPIKLAHNWYSQEITQEWAIVPLLRKAAKSLDRKKARLNLSLEENLFIVSCFGALGSIKQNYQLLTAWLNSSLSKDSSCILLFVGENSNDDYGAEVARTIQLSGLQKQIRITGWVNASTFQDYLRASDVAVQLRTLSRGETSAAVLDCMNYGLPTIVNAHGSMAELPSDAVLMISDEFSENELTEALERLKYDEGYRRHLGKQARQVILRDYSPDFCAQQYQQVIEKFYIKAETKRHSLINAIAQLDGSSNNQEMLPSVAASLAKTLPNRAGLKQILVDVSALVQEDLKTGIQRVVRSILRELLFNPPKGYRVEPVYGINPGDGYRYARRFTLELLDCPQMMLYDEHLEVHAGDIFLFLDLYFGASYFANDLQMMRQQGVQIYFVVYDLLPLQLPHCFPKESEEQFLDWLKTFTQLDGALCISHTVATELKQWLNKHSPERLRPFRVEWFHLGSDLENSIPTSGLPENASEVLSHLSIGITFLMVGTVEPRKGHALVLSALEQLWAQGVQVNLVIVGKKGWMVEDLANRLRSHPQLNHHLFWLQGISDEYLEKVYAVSTALIAASEGEGFGLPLIEAAQRGLPIVARDIPVFREVAGDHAFYCSGSTPEEWATSLAKWLQLYERAEVPQSRQLKWLNWRQSTQQLLRAIGLLGENVSRDDSSAKA